MKKLCMKCLCLLLAACLLPGAAAPAEDVVIGPEAAAIEPEDAPVTAEAMDAAVAEAEADLDAVDDGATDPDPGDDGAAVPETEVDLDAAYEDGLVNPEAEAVLQEYLWEAGSAVDGDALFAGYVDRLFGLGRVPLFEARYTGGDLTGAKRALYDVLRGYVTEAAAGERASTLFEYRLYNDSLSVEDVRNVIDCLIADCPYELYWYNGQRSATFDRQNNRIIISMGVGSGYGVDYFTIDTARVSRAQVAAANARAIVDRYAGSPDYDRLVGYRNAICDMTSYNDAATDSSWPVENADPWQLIWVFDGDASTDVVCEGYAKAFQYLCDMTAFNGSVMCYSVTGTLDGWGHKWNIVRMPNGKNYLADITQCDQEQAGTYDWMFMKAPTGGSVSEGYSFSVRNGNRAMNCHYRYDAEALGIYGTGDLTLSPYGYADEAGLSGQGSVEYDLDALYTDDGQGGGASGAGIETLSVRGNARATVAVGSVYRIDPGGSKGTRFKSSNRKVVRVSSGGLVTPRRAGRAKITFRVGRKRRTLTLKVVDPTVPTWVALSLSGTVAARRGDRLALTAGIPAGTRSGLTWKSSNRRVASVNKNGLVTFKRPGRVTITVTTKRGKRKARVTFVVGR